MSASLPRLSVCIPVFRGERTLAATVASVQAQDIDGLEILIQDNASDDGTWALMQELAAADHRIRIARNEANLGMVGNWNRVVARARGAAVMLLSADDRLRPGCLRRALAALDGADVVTVNHLIDDRGRLRQRRMPIRHRGGIYRDCAATVLLFNPFSINFTIFGAAALRRLRAGGDLFHGHVFATDYDLWFRVARSGLRVRYLSAALAVYTVHDSNLSGDRSRMFADALTVIAGHGPWLNRRACLAYRVTHLRFLLRGALLCWRGRLSSVRLLALPVRLMGH